MAEIAGLALGAVSILGLFNNAVDSFEYIQIAKGLGKNFQTCQLKLDAARISLSRWGKSLGLEDVNKARTLKDLGLDPSDVTTAEEFLTQINDLFADAQVKADRYKKNTKVAPDSLVTYDASRDLDKSALVLHKQMGSLSLARQGNFSKRDKIRWALYDHKTYERLVTDIGELVEKLVEQFPAAQPVQKQLAEAEVKAFKEADANALPLAKEAALDEDKILKDAIEKILKASGQRVYNNTANFYGDNNSGVQIGQQIGGNTSYNFGGNTANNWGGSTTNNWGGKS